LYQILLIVCLLIVYGSLYPFQFHHTALPAGPLWVLLHSWPTHIDRFLVRDVIVNIAIYVPLGTFGFVALAERRGATRLGRAAGAVLLLALGLSASMEMVQLFDAARSCAMSDVVSNTAGAAIGIALGAHYRKFLRRAAARWEPRHPGFSGALLLLYCWAAYQVFPLFPSLGRTALAAHIRFLFSAASFGYVDLFGAWVAWMAAARLLEDLFGRPRAARAMLALICLLPLRLLVMGRNLTASELLGSAAAWVVWSLWPAFLSRRTRILAVLLLVFLAVEGLAPFRVAAAPHAFHWMPFAGALSAAWISVMTVMLLKSYWYGATVWMCRAAGMSLIASTAAVAALLAAMEVIQRRLPGRTSEITDPLLAVILAVVFWLAERHHRVTTQPQSSTPSMLQ